MTILALDRLVSRVAADVDAAALWVARHAPSPALERSGRLVPAEGQADTDVLVVESSVGLPSDWTTIPIGSTPCRQAIERRGPVLIEDITLEPLWAAVPRRAELDWGAFVALPVMGDDGAVHGVVAATSSSARKWDDDALERLAVVADVAATLFTLDAERAHQRGRLDGEREARLVRREMYDLARDAASTNSELRIARVLADGIGKVLDATLCLLALSEGDSVRLVHGDRVPKDLAADWTVVPADTPVPIVHTSTTGEAVELPDLVSMQQWPMLAAEVPRAGISSFVSIPLLDDAGDPIGAVGIGLDSAATLSPARRVVVDELVRDSASALVRARSARRTASIAGVLQRSLLPPVLVDVDGVAVRWLYEPSADGTEIGGDWYDVVPLSPTVTGFVVGDATGHDVRSAAMMGQVRHVVASQLRDHRAPAQALENTDAYFSALHENILATAIVAIIDVETRRITLASAGHPPPIRAGIGRAEVVDVPPGAPLGSGFGGMVDVELEMDPHEAFVLISDGVYERRGGNMVKQLEALVEAIGATDGDVHRIHDLLRHVATTDTTDDATALVVRLDERGTLQRDEKPSTATNVSS